MRYVCEQCGGLQRVSLAEPHQQPPTPAQLWRVLETLSQRVDSLARPRKRPRDDNDNGEEGDEESSERTRSSSAPRSGGRRAGRPSAAGLVDHDGIRDFMTDETASVFPFFLVLLLLTSNSQYLPPARQTRDVCRIVAESLQEDLSPKEVLKLTRKSMRDIRSRIMGAAHAQASGSSREAPPNSRWRASTRAARGHA